MTPRRSETFAKLVEQQPNNELFRFSLAQALAQECRFRDAIEHFEFCLAQKPDWMMARIHLGKVWRELGQSAEAIAQFQQALKLAIEQKHETPEMELRALLKDMEASR